MNATFWRAWKGLRSAEAQRLLRGNPKNPRSYYGQLCALLKWWKSK